MKKAEEAKKEIEGLIKGAKLTLFHLDLSNLKSIESFVDEFNKLNIPIHIMINNAGIMAIPYKETANGFEMQFGTNHLGHFHLTNLLLPKLIEGQPSRVISLSSVAHKNYPIEFKDISGKGTWYQGMSGKWKAYGQSKTANALFAVEFNRRMHKAGHQITCNAVHPGIISTELSRDLSLIEKVGFGGLSLFSKNIPQGAATSVYVATAPELEGIGGLYFEDCNQSTPKPHACNPVYAEKLWDLSKEMIANALKKLEEKSEVSEKSEESEKEDVSHVETSTPNENETPEEE